MHLERLEAIESKLDEVLAIHRALPEWYPITREFASECGYKTMDGLRKWCYNNLPPDDFEKRGKYWYINVRSLPHVKMRGKSL